MKQQHPIRINADTVKAQIAHLRQSVPSLAEDEEGWLLSLESETDALRVCEELTEKIGEMEGFEEMISRRIFNLKERKEYLEFRTKKLRETLIGLMETAGVKTLPLSIGTLSVRYYDKVVITAPHLLPPQFVRNPPPEPLKNIIKEVLKSGQPVPGAELSSPEPGLSIRTK